MAQKSCINAFNYFQLNSKLNQKKLSSAHGPTCTKRCTATSFLQLSNAYGFARLCASNAHESTINEAQIDNDNWPVTATGFSSLASKKGPSRGCRSSGGGGGRNHTIFCCAVLLWLDCVLWFSLQQSVRPRWFLLTVRRWSTLVSSLLKCATMAQFMIVM